MNLLNLYQNLIKIIKFNFVKFKYLAIFKYKKTIQKIEYFIKQYTFLLLASVLIFAFKYFDIVLKCNDFSNILIALASIVATILALVFTLSLIPIQNAASMWSFSILRIYKKDKVSYITFLFFGLSIIMFILLTVFEKSFDDDWMLYFLFILIGIVLDSLRFYYLHVVSLMDPQSILEKIKLQAFKTIDNIDELAKIVAKNQYFLQDKKTKMTILEASAYKMNQNYPQSIKYWFNDLAEIYQKSVARNDLIVAKATLSYILKILDYFIEKRKINLTFHLVSTGLLPVKEADVTKDIITPLCEVLKDLFDISCKNSTENMALEVIDAYKTMTINLSKINKHLILSPIHYAKDCIKNAQIKESIEIPFQAAQIMYEVHRNIEDETAFIDLDENIIELLEDVARYLYGKNRSEAAEIVVKYLMQLNKFDIHFKQRLERVLEVVYRLIPYGLITEISKNKLFYNPLGEVYSLTSISSIGSIYQYESEQNDTNSLVDMLDVVWRHLRKIAENYDIQNSFMIHEIDSTIEYIADINLYQLREKRVDEKKINDKLKWLLSFYWVAYDKKTVYKEQYLRKCIETLKKIAISYHKNNFNDVALDIQSHIKAILESISKISNNVYLLEDIQKSYDELQEIMEMQK